MRKLYISKFINSVIFPLSKGNNKANLDLLGELENARLTQNVHSPGQYYFPKTHQFLFTY